MRDERKQTDYRGVRRLFLVEATDRLYSSLKEATQFAGFSGIFRVWLTADNRMYRAQIWKYGERLQRIKDADEEIRRMIERRAKEKDKESD